MGARNALTRKQEQLYRSFDVWKRGEGVLYRYRCLEVVGEGRYCVQSRDAYRPPFSEQVSQLLEANFLELLFEEPPGERAGLYPSLQEAVEAHEKDFHDFD